MKILYVRNRFGSKPLSLVHHPKKPPHFGQLLNENPSIWPSDVIVMSKLFHSQNPNNVVISLVLQIQFTNIVYKTRILGKTYGIKSQECCYGEPIIGNLGNEFGNIINNHRALDRNMRGNHMEIHLFNTKSKRISTPPPLLGTYCFTSLARKYFYFYF